MQTQGGSINENDTYKYELKVHTALVVCDDSLKSFVIQDFSCEDQALKVQILPLSDVYIIVMCKV